MPFTNITDTTLVTTHSRGAKAYNTAKGVANTKPPSTGATAGAPGTWTPPGSQPPANAADLGGVTASPATAWTTGQYVQTGTPGAAGQVHWSGTAWVVGVA
jgi:hypothetical protein